MEDRTYTAAMVVTLALLLALFLLYFRTAPMQSAQDDLRPHTSDTVTVFEKGLRAPTLTALLVSAEERATACEARASRDMTGCMQDGEALFCNSGWAPFFESYE